jgi:hypothetical protein
MAVGMRRPSVSLIASASPVPGSGSRGSTVDGRRGRIPRWKYAMFPALSPYMQLSDASTLLIVSSKRFPLVAKTRLKSWTALCPSRQKK